AHFKGLGATLWSLHGHRWNRGIDSLDGDGDDLLRGDCTSWPACTARGGLRLRGWSGLAGGTNIPRDGFGIGGSDLIADLQIVKALDILPSVYHDRVALRSLKRDGSSSFVDGGDRCVDRNRLGRLGTLRRSGVNHQSRSDHDRQNC